MFGYLFSQRVNYIVILVFIVCFGLTCETARATEVGGKNGAGPQEAVRGMRAKHRLERLRTAIAVHKRHARRLMADFGVVASGTGLGSDGEPVIKVFTPHREGSRGIPGWLEGVRVHTEVSGRFYALRHDTCDVSGDAVCETSESWPLPVPIGVSVGHPEISAGTIGARVTDGANVFMLSNNHVLANINQANLDDLILQPGVFDGGANSDDIIAGLTDFEPIAFCTVGPFWFICDQTNTIDAAIALSSSTELGVSTPIGEFDSIGGYGAPSSVLHSAYGNPESLGDEELTRLLGISVQKYGRTTALTTGTVDAINVTVNVCFDVTCQEVARFVDQLFITPGTFSAGGDSGSLIVTDDNLKQPVGLLFAGGSGYTIANRIDLVLNRFGVSIDDREAGRTPKGKAMPWIPLLLFDD